MTPRPIDPLGALGDAHLAVEAQPLGPRPGVRHQQRAEDGDHADDDGGDAIRDIRRQEQVRADADEGGAVADPIEGRVVEGAELGHHGTAAGHLPVEGVGDPAQQEEGPAQADVAQDRRRRPRPGRARFRPW